MQTDSCERSQRDAIGFVLLLGTEPVCLRTPVGGEPLESLRLERRPTGAAGGAGAAAAITPSAAAVAEVLSRKLEDVQFWSSLRQVPARRSTVTSAPPGFPSAGVICCPVFDAARLGFMLRGASLPAALVLFTCVICEVSRH